MNELKVNTEPKKSNEVKIIKLDQGQKLQEVLKLQMNPIQKIQQKSYQEFKAKVNSSSLENPSVAHKHQRDRRFSINPLLRDPLSIEEEERKAIEEKVRVRVEAVAEKAKAEAAEIGYQAGLKKGFEESAKELKAEGAVSLDKFNSLVSEIENAKAEIFEANERFLIELVFRIARNIILKELAVDKEYLSRLTKELVGKLGVRDNVTIRINPEDADIIEKLQDKLRKNLWGTS